MFSTAKYASFMVRLWCDNQDQTPDCWHSEIEHVQTGERWQFDDLNQSLRFLTHMAERLQLPAAPSPAAVRL